MKKVVITLGVLLGGFALLQMAGFFAVKYGLTNVSGVVDERFSRATVTPAVSRAQADWSRGEEWQTFKVAVSKDKPVLEQAAAASGVAPRLLMTVVAVEQLRLFYSEREVFKQVFAPLKLLGSQTQFSWGVAGIKQETAKQVEINLQATSSPFYLGVQRASLLKFTTPDPEQERFQRITDEHNHYYSYLYAGLYLKQVMTQWERAGYPIADRPEILATLYNIGYAYSVPKANPQVGGAPIEIAGRDYTFGGLAYDIYYSSELLDVFPR